MVAKCITIPDEMNFRLEKFNKENIVKIVFSQIAQERLEEELVKRGY